MFMKIPVFARLLASATALTLAVPLLAQDNGSVTDFQLPADQPTPRNEVQGPVIEGIAPPRPVRSSPTPTPTPAPVVIAPAPVQVETVTSTPSPQASEAVRAADAARPQATSTEAASAETPSEATTAPAVDASDTSLPEPTIAQPSTEGLPEPASAPAAPASGMPWWKWMIVVLSVGALGVGAGWFWRSRPRSVGYYEVEEIERPQVPERAVEPVSPPAELPKTPARPRPEAPPARQPAPAPAMADLHDEDEDSDRALRIALEPARLSVSLLNATLSYRILLTNQGDTPLRDISIDGDMISAHASLPQEEQIAGSDSKLENRHLIRTLFPGETKVVSGDFALPLPMIRPIRNGDAALFVPLARLRVVSSGEHSEVIVQTSVVGQRSPHPGGGLQPFRLDLGPRIYSELAQRAFA